MVPKKCLKKSMNLPWPILLYLHYHSQIKDASEIKGIIFFHLTCSMTFIIYCHCQSVQHGIATDEDPLISKGMQNNYVWCTSQLDQTAFSSKSFSSTYTISTSKSIHAKCIKRVNYLAHLIHTSASYTMHTLLIACVRKFCDHTRSKMEFKQFDTVRKFELKI